MPPSSLPPSAISSGFLRSRDSHGMNLGGVLLTYSWVTDSSDVNCSNPRTELSAVLF